MIQRTIILLLTCVALALAASMMMSTLWRVSTGYFKAPFVKDTWIEFRAERMRIEINRHIGTEPPTAEAAFFGAMLQPVPRQFAGVSWSKSQLALAAGPSILLLLVLTAYPTVTILRGPWRRHRRRKEGLCMACGYDLTGNVSGICPECGSHR